MTFEDGQRPKPTVQAVELAKVRGELAATQEQLADAKAAAAVVVEAAPTGAKGWGIASGVCATLATVAALVLPAFGVTVLGLPLAALVGGVLTVLAAVFAMVGSKKFDAKALGELIAATVGGLLAARDAGKNSASTKE